MAYEVVRSDIDFIKSYAWNYCVLDEGHMIKNPKTKITEAVKLVRASHRLILSGTPIQNNVLELWSLFDFLMPGFLGDQAQFNSFYSKPIRDSYDNNASPEAQERGVLAMEALHRQVLPFILRRLKENVLHDLPPKVIQDHYCYLSPLQSRLYHGFIDGQEGSTAEKIEKLEGLQYLRKLCSHPRLVLIPSHPQYKSITQELATQKETIDQIEHSSKLLALRDLLHECGIGQTKEAEQPNNIPDAAEALGHRVLIFCQQRAMIDIIISDLFQKHMQSVSYIRMDGSLPAKDRIPLVNKFNNDPTIDCFLLTTSVGGLGLNLTGADVVIFVEHDWNPMKDLQAMDRAHRIGAKRTVNVYRIITLGTFEERIMSLQKFKIQTANTVINAENQSFGTMDTSTLLDLFGNNNQKEKESDENVTVVKGIKLTELWDESQYTEEYDLDNFIKNL
jgi:TATA-binding protein-associated factor